MRYESGSPAAGMGFALTAYGLWGLTPLYWKALSALPASELLGQRVVWSCAVGVALLCLTRAWGELRAVLASPRRWLPVLVAGLILCGNWLTFLWAVLHDQVLATSLGYYITPLMNVLLGVVVLGERLRPLQTAAVLLAAAGIAQLALAVGTLPWITLVLAVSFAVYGLVRKLAPVDPVVGFAFETLALAPLAAGFLGWLAATGRAVFPTSQPAVDWLVVGTGVITAAPLICFNAAAKRLPLAHLGFFQYIAPSITFGLAVAAFGEPFTRAQGLAFGCVWLALAMFSVESWRGASASGALDAARAMSENRGTHRSHP